MTATLKKELVSKLRPYKKDKRTDIDLRSSLPKLQAEYDRLIAEDNQTIDTAAEAKKDLFHTRDWGSANYRHGSANYTPNKNRVKPLLTWAGSKNRQLATLEKLTAAYRGSGRPNLMLPFCGALGDYFALYSLGVKPDKVLANDLAPEIYGFYSWVKDGGEWDIELLKEPNTEELYIQLREQFNQLRQMDLKTIPSDWFYTLLYRINKTCFNGLWRVNGSGEYNVPVGRCKGGYKQVKNIPDLDRYREMLANVEFSNLDYGQLFPTADYFVYCDPPYFNRFDGYTQQLNQGAFDTNRFFDTCYHWSNRGCAVAVSNSKDAIAFYERNDFEIWNATERRSIAANGDRRQDKTLFGVLN